jgi:hypothetical protein
MMDRDDYDRGCIYDLCLRCFASETGPKKRERSSSCAPLAWAVYLFYISTSSDLTVNQQFGHEATESHSGQRQVIIENGQAF